MEIIRPQIQNGLLLKEKACFQSSPYLGSNTREKVFFGRA